MAQHDRSASIKLVNVNFQLTSALATVDAVIGGYRNIEAQELKLQGKTPVVTRRRLRRAAYDELVINAHRDAIHEAKIRTSPPCRRSVICAPIRRRSWEAFAAAHPGARTELNHRCVVANLCPVRYRSGQRWIKRATRLRTVFITISW